MRIGILEAGDVPDELLAEHGPYPDMFVRLIGSVEPAFQFESFTVFRDRFPGAVDACDGWLITGSKFGAYEEYAWIRRLEQFLRDAYRQAMPLVGICFGHQVLAKALGGDVVKSDAGWGVGLHRYELVAQPAWLDPPTASFKINAMHQDQVVALAAGSTVVGCSDFCPNAVLAYGDRAISFQGHPEFERGYAHDLIEARRGVLVPDEQADAGIASLEGAVDSKLVAHWIVKFFLAARKPD